MFLKILLLILILLENFALFPFLQEKIENQVFSKEDFKITSNFQVWDKVEPSEENEIALLPQRLSFGEPSLSARSFLVLDLDSASVLYEKNSQMPLPPASLVKIMTAVLILERGNLQDIVTISNKAVKAEGNSLYLRAGEQVKVKDLLYGLLLPSSNDASTALAEYLAGSEENFTSLMNDKAKLLGLRHTQFKNPSGLDKEGQWSSAFDLAILTKYALKFPLFLKIVKTPEYQFSTISGRRQKIFNTNELLRFPQAYGLKNKILGVKTGQEEKAGLCLISLAEGKGRKIITVVLRSQARFSESAQLINLVYKNFIWQ